MLAELLHGDRGHFVYTGDVFGGLNALPDQCVQSCVTSPPYWGLRDYGAAGQIGAERTVAEYVETMRRVFAEVRRVQIRGADGTL
jgi:DNA modification methylase